MGNLFCLPPDCLDGLLDEPISRELESIELGAGSLLAQGLDDYERVCSEHLVPSVCRGELNVVSAIFEAADRGSPAVAIRAAVSDARQTKNAEAESGYGRSANPMEQEPSAKRVARGCSSVRHEVSADGKLCDHTALRSREMANFSCPHSGLGVLFYATLSENEEVVGELLSWGADPNWRWTGPVPVSMSTRTFGEVEFDCQMTLDCLCAAVFLGNTSVTQLLVDAGARATLDVWNTLFFFNLHEEDPDVFWELVQILHGGGQNPVPISVAFQAMLLEEAGVVECESLLNEPGSVLWYFPYFAAFFLAISMWSQPGARFLLQNPTRTREAVVYKALLLQFTLLSPTTQDYAKKPADLVSLLVEEGVSVYGWTLPYAKAMLKAWHQLRQEATLSCCDPTQRHKLKLSSFNFDDCPCEVTCCHQGDDIVTPRRLRLCEEVREELTCCDDGFWLGHITPVCPLAIKALQSNSLQNNQMLSFGKLSPLCFLPAVHLTLLRNMAPLVSQLLPLTASGVPWVRTFFESIPRQGISSELAEQYSLRESIPYLHDGPTCSLHHELTAERGRVSLAMCTPSGGVMPSLQSACRDVILTACMTSSTSILSCIEKLPLPPLIQNYLLSG